MGEDVNPDDTPEVSLRIFGGVPLTLVFLVGSPQTPGCRCRRD